VNNSAPNPFQPMIDAAASGVSRFDQSFKVKPSKMASSRQDFVLVYDAKIESFDRECMRGGR
jgi:hypothetical protein